MNNFFNAISAKIFAFTITTIMTISSVFTKVDSIKERLIGTPEPTPVVSETPMPSPIVEENPTPKPIVVLTPVAKAKSTALPIVTQLPTSKPTPTSTNEVRDPTGVDWEQFRKDLEESLKDVSQEGGIKETTINGVPFNYETQTNTEIENALNVLRTNLQRIEDQPETVSVIQGKMQRYYQDWIKDNSDIYSTILNTRYSNDLTTITRSYGL